jgi:DNA-binding response OmpR family regulator
MERSVVHGKSDSTMSAVVVEPSLADALLAVSVLTAAGFHITVAEGFSEAKALLSTRHPSLLISEIRLGEYNGLQLILHGRASRADMVPVLTAHRRDAVLQAEAEQMGGTFVLMPTTESELLAAVMRATQRSATDTTPITEPFERRLADRRLRDDRTEVVVDRRHGQRRALSIVTAAPSWILSGRPRRARQSMPRPSR